MVSPSYLENERLIHGEEERGERIKTKMKIQSLQERTAYLLMTRDKVLVAGQPVTSE